MRNLLFIAISVIFLTSCHKSKVDEQGVKTVYEAGFYTLPGTLVFGNHTAINTSDNNMLICGMSDTRAQLVKMTGKGSVLWQRTFFVDPGAEVSCIAELPQGGYAIAGGDAKNSFVIATNASGQRLWKNYYGSAAITMARQLTATSDNYIILTGSSYQDSSRSIVNIYLGKIKKDGTAVWEKTFSTPAAAGYGVTATANGEILVTGTTAPNGYAQGIYLLKTTANGDKLWERTPLANEKAVGTSSKILANGDIVTFGATHSAGYDGIAVFKFNAEGNKIWEQELTESGKQLQAMDMHANSDGSFIIAGYIQDDGAVDSTDILLVKLDASGNKLWQKTIGGNNEDRAYNIVADAGGLLVIGNTKSYGAKKGEPNIFMLRINDAGDVIY